MEGTHERFRSADHRTRTECKDRDPLRLGAGVAVEDENHLGDQLVFDGQHGTGSCPDLGAPGREVTDLHLRTVGKHRHRTELAERELVTELLSRSCAPGRNHETIGAKGN